MSALPESDRLLRLLKADDAVEREFIQELWSGYGQIARYDIRSGDSPPESVVVKHVRPPMPRSAGGRSHPRGWSTNRSHQRKLRSYQVETEWYQRFADRCGTGCRVPRCLAAEELADGWLLVLEDLNAVGFPRRARQAGEAEWRACVRWLAWFHATWMGVEPEGLWPVGTYWHLDTRPDELDALNDAGLREAASAIDRQLRDCSAMTLVHGDAKLANFCFSADGESVAAVDFQYVGGGCGMKDLAYFVGSCFGEADCEAREEDVLAAYFGALRKALASVETEATADDIEAEWRPLYRVAWADFHRFLKGWSPGHWKVTDYSERVVREVVGALENK